MKTKEKKCNQNLTNLLCLPGKRRSISFFPYLCLHAYKKLVKKLWRSDDKLTALERTKVSKRKHRSGRERVGDKS
jgi:hypothetical protein